MSVDLTLTIAGVQLVIITTSLPDAQVGVAYTTTLHAAGGTGAISWKISSGPCRRVLRSTQPPG